jgi:hypothetical protein
VLAEERLCWLCLAKDDPDAGVFVDVPRHPRSRSVDHVIALAAGGRLLDRSLLRLAHYGCNSSRGARVAASAPRSEDW